MGFRACANRCGISSEHGALHESGPATRPGPSGGEQTLQGLISFPPSRIVVSQCTLPKATLESSLGLFRQLGFSHVEAFTFWTGSRLDPDQSAELYLQFAHRFGLTFHGLHVPPLPSGGSELGDSIRRTEKAIAFAGRLRAGHVYLSAKSEQVLVECASRLLDACEAAGVMGLLEPHDQTPVPDLSSTLRVLERIGDARLKVVLELGHLARAGDDWADFYHALGGVKGGRIVSVHLKNVLSSGQWAPWRQGILDIPALLARLKKDAYEGVFVLETQLPDPQATCHDLQDLRDNLTGNAQPTTTQSTEVASCP